MIYVVEDDRSIRELVAYALESAGYQAETYVTARDFFESLDPVSARLIILDIMLPGEDGLTVLRKLREGSETAHIPVIIMSALGTELDKVKGLDLGADDYISKPFGIKEFLARVRTQLRRHEPREVLTAGTVRMYPAGRRVEAEGKGIVLTAKEFELFEYLIRHSGIAVRRDELLGAVWGYSGGEETRTVDVHIRSLRSKLGAAGNMIETVRGVGYRLEKLQWNAGK